MTKPPQDVLVTVVTVWKCGNLNIGSYWTIKDCINPKRSFFDIYLVVCHFWFTLIAWLGDAAKEFLVQSLLSSSSLVASYEELAKNPLRFEKAESRNPSRRETVKFAQGGMGVDVFWAHFFYTCWAEAPTDSDYLSLLRYLSFFSFR